MNIWPALLQPPNLLMNRMWKDLVRKLIKYLSFQIDNCLFIMWFASSLFKSLYCCIFIWKYVRLYIILCYWLYRKWSMLTGLWMLLIVVLEWITGLNILGRSLSTRWFYLTWKWLAPAIFNFRLYIFIKSIFDSVESHILLLRYVL